MAKQKKSLKGSVAILAMNFLRFLNMVIIVGGAATIVMVFLIQSPPTFPAGWGFFFLSTLIILSGLFGTIASGQVGCFECHLFCLFISAAGLCASTLMIFLRFKDVVLSMKPNADPYQMYDAEQYVRILGALYFFIFMTQMVILMLGCTVHHFGLIEHNEDLDALKSARELARSEEIHRRPKIDGWVPHKLTEKMKHKYRQWTHRSAADEEEAAMEFDMESSVGSQIPSSPPPPYPGVSASQTKAQPVAAKSSRHGTAPAGGRTCIMSITATSSHPPHHTNRSPSPPSLLSLPTRTQIPTLRLTLPSHSHNSLPPPIRSHH
ncbi:unnamed protein product [Closterium sp. Naga37s-1]|nr:unnamed protein product [Closterium sp. Naga37s-1]CAI5525668.1 unnamed protein product [Closterium sp. Naga37s-1]